jgi:hypothetical protein
MKWGSYYKILCWVSDFDGFFGTTEATENRHETWDLMSKMFITQVPCKRVAREWIKYKLDLVVM